MRVNLAKLTFLRSISLSITPTLVVRMSQAPVAAKVHLTHGAVLVLGGSSSVGVGEKSKNGAQSLVPTPS